MRLDQKEFTYKDQEFLITLEGEPKHEPEIKQTWEEQGEPERFDLNVDYEDSQVLEGTSFNPFPWMKGKSFVKVKDGVSKNKIINEFCSDNEEFISDQVKLYLEP